MKLWSDGWTNGERIPARYAAGRLSDAGEVQASDNISPHLAWSDLPPGTCSLAIICQDFDAPAQADLPVSGGKEIAADVHRVDFFHWLLVDLPPSCTGLAEGEFSRGFTLRGKPGPQAAHGARQGLNDYTGWFASDPGKAGQYFGFDGPFPPAHDALVHHYVLTLFALAVPRLAVAGAFTGAQVRAALPGLVLADATLSATYTLNRRLWRDG